MEKVKLNELANIYLGVTHTPEYVLEGVPFLSVKDISGGKICFDDCKYISQEEYDSLSEGAKPKVGDMLFCRVGTLGKPIIIPEGTPLFGSFVSLGYLRNRNSDRCDLNYLRYWMYSNSFWKQVNANVKGASQINLNTGWLSKFYIDLPGIAEQRYRISVLDKCKSVIEEREAELAALDDLIKARFVEMFGDMIINPNGWGKVLLGEACDVRDGTHDSPKYFTEGYPLVTSKNVTGGKIDFADCSLICEEDYNKINQRSKVDMGDILMPMIGTVGNPVIVDIEAEFAIKNVALIKFRENSTVINSFVKALLESDYFDRAVISKVRGGTQKFISLGDIRKLEICLPPIAVQEQFSDFAKQVDKSKVAVQKALDETQTLFDSLMQEYFG